MSSFPFVTTLLASWQTIRAEYQKLAGSDLIPWHERFLYGEGWDIFALHAFGSKVVDNCARCPETARLCETVPGMTTAGFSILQPETHIEPHVGYTDKVLRFHLGLIVPQGCWIKVGGETRSWAEGESFIFDDTVEHEVRHEGQTPRAVLIIDFKRDASPTSWVDVRSDDVRREFARLSRAA